MTYTVRRLPTAPVRICIVEELPGGTIRHDMLALSVEDARRVGAELITAAGGVPPTTINFTGNSDGMVWHNPAPHAAAPMTGNFRFCTIGGRIKPPTEGA